MGLEDAPAVEESTEPPLGGYTDDRRQQPQPRPPTSLAEAPGAKPDGGRPAVAETTTATAPPAQVSEKEKQAENPDGVHDFREYREKEKEAASSF